jgi:hypothetical protein
LSILEVGRPEVNDFFRGDLKLMICELQLPLLLVPY